MCLKLILTKLKAVLTKASTIIPTPAKSSSNFVIGTTDLLPEKLNDKQILNIGTTTMSKGEQIVETARKEIGVFEDPPNSNKVKYNTWFYGKEVSGSAYPWCAVFVSWIFAQAGFPLGNIGFKNGFAGVQTGVDYFRKTNQLSLEPVAGDIVCFDWTGDGHFDHTGIFVRNLADNHFESIEGNTSLANQSNGGAVMLRTRNKINILFVHPNILNEV